MGLRIHGVYKILCECGLSYIGQTGFTVEDHCKEHQLLHYPDKSSLAQHSIETGHRIHFAATTVMSKILGYWDYIITEAVEIQASGNTLNIYIYIYIGLQLSAA